MEFALSTYLFVEERLSTFILDQILGAGFRQIEIFAARQHFDYREANQVRDTAQWFKDHGLQLHSLHAPLFPDTDWGRSGGQPVSITYTERGHRINSMDEIKRAIDVAERVPFKYLIVHMGLADEEYDLRKFDAAFTSIEHLRIFAKERGAQVLLENIPNELSTAERLLSFIHYTRMDNLKLCFDVGHAHMLGNALEAFEALKDRIASTHVHDNNKEKDDHLVPFEGEILWPQLVRGFRAGEGQFPVLFEVRNEGPEKPVLPRLSEAMKRMEEMK